MDGADAVTPDLRGPGAKLSLLLEGKSLPEDQKGEWICKHGLHSEHLPLWAQELTTFITDKQADLVRKDRALVEAAVMTTLKKTSGISLRTIQTRRPDHRSRTRRNLGIIR